MIDAKLLFCEEQAITWGSGISDNVIDLGAGETSIGEEENLRLVCFVVETFVGGTSMAIHFQQCATEGGTYTDLLVSDAYLPAELVAGTKIFDIGLPCKHQRYLALDFVEAGTFTAGKVTAFIPAR